MKTNYAPRVVHEGKVVGDIEGVVLEVLGGHVPGPLVHSAGEEGTQALPLPDRVEPQSAMETESLARAVVEDGACMDGGAVRPALSHPLSLSRYPSLPPPPHRV